MGGGGRYYPLNRAIKVSAMDCKVAYVRRSSGEVAVLRIRFSGDVKAEAADNDRFQIQNDPL